ncbi:hypothetical protein C1646_764522 [Rhizophagus diaphanus]|nr:hypothetical protein C1646_764522 [Rhizophagus diaphanus] [Rhizophagus sp. MUCL 43196]
MSEIFFQAVCNNLKTFVTDGLLQTMFSKSSDSTLDKATFLVSTFGEDADPKQYLELSKAMNIQPMTLSLIMSIATHSTAVGWDEYKKALYKHEHGVDTYSDLEDSDDCTEDDDTDIIIESTPLTPTPNPVPILQQELPDIVMTPVDPPVTPEISRKEEINNSTRVPMDKQVTNQSKKGNNNNRKKKSLANNSSVPAVTEVLTGYEVSNPEEQGRICDIIFNNNWTTDLGGIPVRWFPASWTLRERK